MSSFKFTLNEEYSKKLNEMAEKQCMNVQDFIRFKIFEEKSIFTVDEAIRRIQNGDFKNKEFSLPDVFGDDWLLSMSRNKGAGTLGKQFYIFITTHPDLGIRFVPNKKIQRRSVYTYIKED